MIFNKKNIVSKISMEISVYQCKYDEGKDIGECDWELRFEYSVSEFNFVYWVNQPYLFTLEEWYNLADGMPGHCLSFCKDDKEIGAISVENDLIVFFNPLTKFSIPINILAKPLKERINEAADLGLVFADPNRSIYNLKFFSIILIGVMWAMMFVITIPHIRE
jgi:hypothetical protein